MREALEAMADRIEFVLHTHRILARVKGGRVGPRTITFELLTTIGTRVETVARLEQELALYLGVDNVFIKRNGGVIEIEIPRQHIKQPALPRLLQRLADKRIPSTSVLVGVDDEGQPVLIRLSSSTVAHVLVAGTTGSGKTTLLNVMGLSLAQWHRQKDVQIVVIDPKRSGLSPLTYVPHLWHVAYEHAEIVNLLSRLVQLMEYRDQLKKQVPRVVVFVDEIVDIVQTNKEALPLFTRLLQRGRSAGVHIIAATQKPSARVLGGQLVANFPLRIVGRVVSAHDALVATGVAKTMANRLRRGEFILVHAGDMLNFVAPEAKEETLVELARNVPGARKDTILPKSSLKTTRITHQDVREDLSSIEKYAQAFLRVWKERNQGKPLTVSASVQALGKRPGGANWHIYVEAHKMAKRLLLRK